jgi:hypothetical protein
MPCGSAIEARYDKPEAQRYGRMAQHAGLLGDDH